MKAIKRAMAAEYSRALGDKVLAAGKHWAEHGFKQGGSSGYGLQRAMVAAGMQRFVSIAYSLVPVVLYVRMWDVRGFR